MKKHVSVAVVVALATIVLAGTWEFRASADAKRFRAYVYPDRTRPEMSVVVEDFRINETVWDLNGVQYLWVRGPAGSFKVPFSDLGQIEVIRFLGLTQIDWARYEVKVTELESGVVHVGTTEVRVLRGIADGEAWYYYPATQKDRGTNFWRIVVGNDRVAPTIPPEQAPAEAPAPVAVVTQMEPMPAASAPEPAMSDFDRLTLDELNAHQPLADVFFDFDRDEIRPDASEALARNAEWLKRHPSTTIRIEGYADPRGTQEYNVELGQRRATATREYLVRLGIEARRIDVASHGAAQAFCSEQTEACWARNRRSHFVFTAK